MPTNEEIREEYTIVMSGYEPKARGTKADRELCLMNEARADTAKQMFKFFNSISQNIVTKEDWDLFIKEFNIKEKEE
jgi:hypothetical protein